MKTDSADRASPTLQAKIDIFMSEDVLAQTMLGSARFQRATFGILLKEFRFERFRGKMPRTARKMRALPRKA